MIPNKVGSKVEWFAEEMEKQLKENDFKYGYRIKHSTEYLYFLGRAQAKLSLMYYLYNESILKGEYSKEILIECCADCANCCMMMADNLSKHKK
ncbi:hypothetical protein ES705_11756 [subsurface metagenome]